MRVVIEVDFTSNQGYLRFLNINFVLACLDFLANFFSCGVLSADHTSARCALSTCYVHI